jgi:tetratricopeptide (TPR) repeat protein
MKHNRFFLLAGILCALLLFGHGSASAKDQWIQVRSKNFVLIGNASEKDIRRVGTRLEQFRETFRNLFTKTDLTGSIPTNVVVFKSASSYKPFKPLRSDGKADTGIAGYFQSGEDVNYITLSTEGTDEDTYGTIFHEYVHFILNTNFGKSEVPLWFNEGMAEYYQTFEIADDINVKLGLTQPNHLYLLRESKLMPLDMLFNATSRQVHGTGGHSRSIFYAQSWALVHYLMQSRKSEALGDFLTLLVAGGTPQEAFEQAFKIPYKQMESDLKKYISSNSYLAWNIKFKNKLTFDADMQVSMLDDAASNTYLGDLLYHTHRYDDAEPFLVDALKLSPDNPLANITLGMVKIRQRKFDEARTFLEKAIGSDPKNHLAYYQYAFLLSREGRDEFGYVRRFAPETAAKMRETLRKAIALNPAFTESYDLLAFVSLVNNEEMDEAVTMLKKALRYQPGNQRYALRVAEIYSRQNKFAESKAIAEKISKTTDDDEVRQRAEGLIANLAQMEAYEKQRNEFNAARSGIGRTPQGGPPPPALNEARSAEASMRSLNEMLRPLGTGEKRVLGHVQKIDCAKRPVVFTVAAGGETYTLTTKDFSGLDVGAFDAQLGATTVACDGNISAINTVITFRSDQAAGASMRGELVALEFVPPTFRLMTEQEMAKFDSAAVAENERQGPPAMIVSSDGESAESARRKMILESMRSRVRTPGPGEKRQMGFLEAIQCKGPNMLFTFKTGGGLVKVAAPKPPQIMMFVQDLAGVQFGCGMKPIEYPAAFVFSDKPNTKSKTLGDLLSIDFLPIGFTLE